MPRAFATGTLTLVALLCAMATRAEGQAVDNPLVPRGSLFLRMDPSATTTKGIYGSSGSEDLGGAFDGLNLGSQEITSLASSASRFGMLAGASGSPAITIGTTRARFSDDEKVIALRLSYGILDRLTVGVTVPVIRKRIDSALGLSTEGADVGLNPGGSAANTFLNDADEALVSVSSAVEDACAANGDQDPDCVAGRALVSDADGFLTGLGEAYDEETLFPLAGSELGQGIVDRWEGLVAAFMAWGAEGMGSPPLATEAVDQSTFESLAVDPAWPLPGFPLEKAPVLWGIGDVELNAAVGLLRADPTPSAGDERVQINASVVGSLRFATGSPDSLRTVSPADPPRGVSGFTLGAVADLLLPHRLAVLATVEGGWYGTTETTLLAPDPQGVLTPGRTRAQVRWTPGSHLRASLTPRFRLAPGLSIGAGWHILRRQPDEFKSIDGEGDPFGPILPLAADAYTLQRVAFELRYTALEEPMASGVPFPFELLLRFSRSVTGSEGAPVDNRAEAMVRVRLWDRN